MSKRTVLMVPLLVLLCISPVFVWAALTYDVMPGSGLSTQSILISVRNDPITGDYKQFMYVFVDGILVVDRMACVDLKNGNYMYMWDKSITLPKAASGYGEHTIIIWIETEFGLRKTLPWKYMVTDGLPTTVESWKQFLEENPEILTEITGPKGDKGDTGEKGDTPTINYRTLANTIDYETLWLRVPTETLTTMTGPQGEQGIQGIPGIDGENYSLGLLIVSSLVSMTASGLFTYYMTEIRRRSGA